MKKYILSLFVIIGLMPLSAQKADIPDATNCYFIKNGLVTSRPGMQATKSSIIIRNGLVESIGPNLNPPFDAKVIDVDSMYIYPGFIDPLSHTGIKDDDKKEKGSKNDRPKSPGVATFKQAGITPQITAIEKIKESEKSIKSMRKAGFGISHTVPKGYILPGQGSIISLKNSNNLDEIILKSNVSMFGSLKTKRGVFPSTLIGAMSRLREVHKNTGIYIQNHKSYSTNALGMKRPSASKEYEAFTPVYNKKQTLFFIANTPKQIHRAVTLQKELGFKMVLSDVKLISPILDIVGNNTPILLSLKLPKEIKEDDDKDKKGSKKKKKKKNELTPEQQKLTKRKKESYDKYLSQAKTLADKGIPFAFSYLNIGSGDILKSVRRMIGAGLSEEKALSALTTSPAKILNISNYAGTLEKGKLGNLVISEKPIFDEKATIRYIFVEGQITEIEKKKKKDNKGDGEMGDISGTWRYTVTVPDDIQEGNIFINKDGDSYKIKLESDQDPGEFEDGEDVEVDGNAMSFSMTIDNDGMMMDLTFDVKFEGNDMEGTVSITQFGSFPIEAVKRAIPD